MENKTYPGYDTEDEVGLFFADMEKRNITDVSYVFAEMVKIKQAGNLSPDAEKNIRDVLVMADALPGKLAVVQFHDLKQRRTARHMRFTAGK